MKNYCISYQFMINLIVKEKKKVDIIKRSDENGMERRN